jgi:predicted amidohydrolase YtcJ
VTGSVEVGKYADLIVLDQDLFQIPIQDVSDVQVLLTLLEGEVMYGNLEEF